MKLVFALALLVASVTLFGATNASSQSGIQNELEELDLLIRLDNSQYALDGLVSKVRDALQRVVDRIKQKLADNKGLFEQFRSKIDEVQEKIRDLVIQGKGRLTEAVNQIRLKLQSLIKSVFDKINDLGTFYESQEQEQGFIERTLNRLRDLVQRGLEALQQRVEKSKLALEDVKVKIQEIKEKLSDLANQAGVKAIQTLADLRQKLRDIFEEVTKKIGGGGASYSANYGVEELPALLAQAKIYVLSDKGFNAVKGIASRVQSTNPVVNFVQLFINSQSDDTLKALLLELFESGYQAHADIPVDLFTKIRDILVTEEGIKEIRKYGDRLQSTHPIVIHVAGILASVSDDELRQVIDEIFTALDSSSYSTDQFLAAYYEGESILELFGQRLRELAQRALDALEKKVSQAKEVAAIFKEKIQELKEQITELGQETGSKAVALFQQIRQKIQELLKEVANKITGESAFYESEEQQGSLIQRLVERVRTLAQRALQKLKDTIGDHTDLLDKLKEKIADVQQKIADLGKKLGGHAVEAVNVLRKSLSELAKQVRDSLTGSSYAALIDDDQDEDESLSIVQRLVQSMRNLTQRALDRVKQSLENNKEIFEEFKDKIELISRGLVNLAKQTGREALKAVRELRQKVHDLNRAILQRLTGKSIGLYAAENAIAASLYQNDESVDQGLGQIIEAAIRRVVQKVKELVQRALEQVKAQIAQSKELLGDFKERVQELSDQLVDLSKKTASEAVKAVQELRQKAKDLLRDIKERITGKVSFYEGETEVVEPNPTIFQKIIQGVRNLAQRVLERVQSLVANSKDIRDQIKAKVDEVKAELARITKEAGAKALETAQHIRQHLRELVQDVAKRIANIGKGSSYQSEDTANKIRHLVILIRETLKTRDALKIIKNYLDRLDTTNPRINLLRSFVQASSDDDLREILKEFFSSLDHIHIADYPANSDNLGKLFGELRDQITTDDGIRVLQNYARGLQTTNPIVAQVKNVVENAAPENIRIVLEELFSGLA